MGFIDEYLFNFVLLTCGLLEKFLKESFWCQRRICAMWMFVLKSGHRVSKAQNLSTATEWGKSMLQQCKAYIGFRTKLSTWEKIQRKKTAVVQLFYNFFISFKLLLLLFLLHFIIMIKYNTMNATCIFP